MSAFERSRVLLVGPDLETHKSLHVALQDRTFEVVMATRGEEGLAKALQESFDVVASDIRMPGISGLELLARLRVAKPPLPVILTTSYATADSAIEASRLGAYKYVPKPFDIHDFVALIGKAARQRPALSAILQPQNRDVPSPTLIGASPAMFDLYSAIGRAAESSASVLIRGPTGTGKELVARSIHQHSNRSKRPFIAVNCNALVESLFESELFGHESGAFSGAHGTRIGRFEEAHTGILLLDEIGDLRPPMQVKLLRVLETKHIQRVGSNKEIHLDVRVVAATHRNLEKAMEAKEFREDLFYRLSTFTIHTPELREHAEDVVPLAQYFLQRCANEEGRDPPCIHREAAEFLQAQAWPGNVRQLQNVIRRAISMARHEPIGLAHVQDAYGQTRPALCPYLNPAHCQELLRSARAGQTQNALRKVLQETECVMLKEALTFTQGNKAEAARCLGMGRTTLRQKLEQFGILRRRSPCPGTPRADRATGSIQTVGHQSSDI